MAENSESITERMERKRVAFDKRVIESKETIKEHRESFEQRSNVNELSIKVDIDVSEALKGLKAVQREAKNTARVLREVEGTEIFEWEKEVQKLAKRTGTFGLLNDILVLGRKSLREVKALNNLTDKELEEYERLLEDRYLLSYEEPIKFVTKSYKKIIKDANDESLLKELARRGIEVEVKNKTDY